MFPYMAHVYVFIYTKRERYRYRYLYAGCGGRAADCGQAGGQQAGRRTGSHAVGGGLAGRWWEACEQRAGGSWHIGAVSRAVHAPAFQSRIKHAIVTAQH